MRCKKSWSVCLSMQDTNYAATSTENQADILLKYEQLIKSVASDVHMKVLLVNRLTDPAALQKQMLPACPDTLPGLGHELQAINMDRAMRGENRITRDRLFVLHSEKKNAQEARRFFRRVTENLFREVQGLETRCRQLKADERLDFLLHLFRPEVKEKYKSSGGRHAYRHIRDEIAPDGFHFPFYGTWMRIGARYARVLMIRDFPALMGDALFTEILDLPREMILCADYAAMGKEEAVRLLNRHKDRVESDVRKRTVSSGREGNWNAELPRHLEEERETCAYFFDCVNREDQRLVQAQVTILHMADSLEALNADTAAIRAAASGRNTRISPLRARQEAGLNTVLPYGLDEIRQSRIISSENAAFLCPFRTTEISDADGIVYGVNEISGNLICADRKAYKNGNGFIVGDAGGGKSVLAKYEILSVYLSGKGDLIILDPDGEYSTITKRLGGQVIRIAADSSDHINMMAMSDDFDQADNQALLKCALVSGAVDLMMRGAMTGAQRSVTDRVVLKVLSRDYGRTPTLRDVYDALCLQKEPAAQEAALAMELYATGSLSTFSHPTNVNIQNRLVCFDIKDLTPQMRDLGMMVVLDEIDRRVAANRRRGIHTWVWADEIWTLLHYPQTEEYLWGFWKRCRKYGGLPTGITQSLRAVQESEKGKEMLSNSEFIFMMGMSAEDREAARELFSLSDDQMGYLQNAEPGHGLLRAGRTIVPLDATIPRSSELYKIATTRLGEASSG